MEFRVAVINHTEVGDDEEFAGLRHSRPAGMDSQEPVQPDHRTSMRAWEQNTPWHRRFSMRMGLEKKLVLCFMAVLSAALTVTCYTFASETHVRLSDIMAEQARQMAMALSLTSEVPMRSNDWSELNRRGQELIKNRNILFVGLLDTNASPRTIASRDPDFDLTHYTFDSRFLMQAQTRYSPTFGEFLEVVSPILSSPRAGTDSRDVSGPRLLGYVVVGVSQAREEAQMLRVNYIIVGITCLMLMCALPVAFLLVHRVFLPIRKLVNVTRSITAGDLDARVEIHRPDVIGDLARSFDDMVIWVKQQQEDLEHANHDLERKIEHRTAQLETANTRLSSEITEKEEFLRTVSHDLNAPLRNIAGMVTMLLMKNQKSMDDDMIHRLQRIKSNVEIETGLIGELLELSRIKTRRHNMEPVEVCGIVHELRDLFESDLREKGVELHIDTPLPVLQAERMRMRQVFQNLIDNAIKYMGDGPTREIHIGCKVTTAEAEFYVRDTGLGIHESDIAKVFFVFRRGQNTLAQNIAGKGVGLASVKSIIETYNGRIWVTSEVGKGSTFRFTINGKFVPHSHLAETISQGENRA